MTSKYGLWAAAKCTRDAADAVFQMTAFESDHPEAPATEDDMVQVSLRVEIVQQRIRELLIMIAPF